MLSTGIGCVATKILHLLSKKSGPISIVEINERLSEPIGLIHLGVSQLVREGRIHVESEGRGNFITSALPQEVFSEDRESQMAHA